MVNLVKEPRALLNDEDALYMNWGSDGADNGWYESTGLNGFTYGAGMIVNLDWAPNN